MSLLSSRTLLERLVAEFPGMNIDNEGSPSNGGPLIRLAQTLSVEGRASPAFPVGLLQAPEAWRVHYCQPTFSSRPPMSRALTQATAASVVGTSHCRMFSSSVCPSVFSTLFEHCSPNHIFHSLKNTSSSKVATETAWPTTLSALTFETWLSRSPIQTLRTAKALEKGIGFTTHKRPRR